MGLGTLNVQTVTLDSGGKGNLTWKSPRTGKSVFAKHVTIHAGAHDVTISIPGQSVVNADTSVTADTTVVVKTADTAPTELPGIVMALHFSGTAADTVSVSAEIAA